MKKYKLIKKYPGSPKLETILTPKVDLEDINTNNFYWEGSWFNPNDYPTFWEEVVESNYEILKTCPIEGTIYSVKRISDGEIFTIGDKARTSGSNNRHIIRQFRVKQKCFGRNFSGGYTYDGIDRIWVDWEENCGGNWLESTEKLRQPVFMTHDDKVIFAGDKVWWVNIKDGSNGYGFGGNMFYPDTFAYFLTEEDSINFRSQNEVLFKTHDGVDVRKGDVIYIAYYDNPDISSIAVDEWRPKVAEEGSAWFSTRKGAENYRVQTLKTLSIEDFWEFQSWGGSNIAKSTRLKRLVKERLGYNKTE